MTVNQGCFLFICNRGPIYDVYIGGKVSCLIWAKYVTRINLWIDYVYLSLHIKGSLNSVSAPFSSYHSFEKYMYKSGRGKLWRGKRRDRQQQRLFYFAVIELKASKLLTNACCNLPFLATQYTHDFVSSP